MNPFLVEKLLDQKPAFEEYPSFYHKYVDALPAGSVFQTLESQLKELRKRLGNLTEAQWDFRYAEGKWSVSEVLCHLIDAERVFSFRAAAFARGDKNALPGFDENDYVVQGNLADHQPGKLLLQFEHLRRANILLYSTFSDALLARTGMANGKQISVRAIVFITAGHVQHHLNILKERYGV